MDGRRTIIRNSDSAVSAARATTAELKQQIFAQNRVTPKRRVKHGPKSTTIAAYMGVFLLIMSMVAIGYQPPQKVDSLANATATTVPTPAAAAAGPSVDEVVATNIAASIAERANLPVAANIANQSVSLIVQSQLGQQSTADSTISKPQIIQPSSGSRTISHYVTKAGDSVPSVAAKFSVSTDTVKWANDLTSDTLNPGTNLTILPVSGVLYTVQSGDTVASIAKKFNLSTQEVVGYNDLELGGLATGKKIILPSAILPVDERPGYVAPSYGYTTGYSIGGHFSGAMAGNGYAFGNCTWYAYNRRVQMGLTVGSFWGNASTWAMAAAANGYRVDNTPSVGAIAQWNAYSGSGIGYYGHVGIVESVNSDGTITISEMNNYAYGGFNVVDRRTISPSSVSNFIH